MQRVTAESTLQVAASSQSNLQSSNKYKNSLNIGLRANFLSSQKLLAAILLQKRSIMQMLGANILVIISIVNIVSECFLP